MKSKKSIVLGILSVCIIAVALIFMLLDALIPLNVWTHPVLNFLFCICLGFGIMVLSLAFIKQSTWFFFVSAILFGLSFFYVLIQYIPWWLCLIIVIALWVLFAIMSVMVAGNMTESISLNKSPDYKTFDERKAEEKAKEAATEKPEKPLPEIKSFK